MSTFATRDDLEQLQTKAYIQPLVNTIAKLATEEHIKQLPTTQSIQSIINILPSLAKEETLKKIPIADFFQPIIEAIPTLAKEESLLKLPTFDKLRESEGAKADLLCFLFTALYTQSGKFYKLFGLYATVMLEVRPAQVLKSIEQTGIENFNAIYLTQDTINGKVGELSKELKAIGMRIDDHHKQISTSTSSIRNDVVQAIRDSSKATNDDLRRVTDDHATNMLVSLHISQDRVISNIYRMGKTMLDFIDRKDLEVLNAQYLVQDKILGVFVSYQKDMISNLRIIQNSAARRSIETTNTQNLVRDKIIEEISKSQGKITNHLDLTANTTRELISQNTLQLMNAHYLVQDKIIEEVSRSGDRLNRNYAWTTNHTRVFIAKKVVELMNAQTLFEIRFLRNYHNFKVAISRPIPIFFVKSRRSRAICVQQWMIPAQLSFMS